MAGTIVIRSQLKKNLTTKQKGSVNYKEFVNKLHHTAKGPKR